MSRYLKYAPTGIEWVFDHDTAAIFETKESAEKEVKRFAKDKAFVTEHRHYWIIERKPSQENAMTQQARTKTSFAKNGRVKNPNKPAVPATNNPFANNKPKGDLADRVSDSVAKSFSPGGLIVFGGGVFASALILNLGFWGSITSGLPAGQAFERILMQDWAVLGGAVGGWAISLGTTFFQTYPIIGRKGGDSIAKQFLASLFRPDLTRMEGGDETLAHAHNGIQADFWKMMGWMWFICTAAETLAGIIFIGDVFGKGLASLGALLLFIFSIAGCQIGAYWIIQGRNIRLPKEGRGMEARLNKAEISKAYSQLK
jgi:hypothetical protein